MVINFGVKKSGCGKSVGLVLFPAKYVKFSRQRDPHRLTDTYTRFTWAGGTSHASHGLEEPEKKVLVDCLAGA
jgi:hypothetical protein